MTDELTVGRKRPGTVVRVRVREVNGSDGRYRDDQLATEEPMEIRLAPPGEPARSLVVTMRTPGADFELAAGFLSSEGIVGSSSDVRRVAYCVDPELTPEQLYNVVTVELDVAARHLPAPRYGAATSACGVCGKESLDELELRGCSPVASGPVVEPEVLHTLADRLRDTQNVFTRTGGLHASGLFSADGTLLCAREDVGRHNAVDKVVGWALLNDKLPLTDTVLMVSGRAGYEITQKALAAGIPFVAAVGAPSSLAVDLAKRFGMTLAGFVRGERFVLYSHPERVALD